MRLNLVEFLKITYNIMNDILAIILILHQKNIFNNKSQDKTFPLLLLE